MIGHLRFALESIGPELRQYVVTDNDQERPFSRDQRRWVYTSAKDGNRYFGFGTGVDFVTIDGGEGGTGAAPLVYSDHVALPFKLGFPRVYRTFAEADLHHRVVFIGSGKLGIPENALLAMALGCDLVNVGRTAMFAVGCVQAQRCRTGRCPTGVATQSPWLQRGLDPADKSVRVANYLATLRFELASLGRACGHAHPALVRADQLELLDVDLRSVSLAELFDYQPGWGLPA